MQAVSIDGVRAEARRCALLRAPSDCITGARGFDGLLVGVYENKEFILVAKVKNGFGSSRRCELPSCPMLWRT
jgi:hypothetical protein